MAIADEIAGLDDAEMLDHLTLKTYAQPGFVPIRIIGSVQDSEERASDTNT